MIAETANDDDQMPSACARALGSTNDLAMSDIAVGYTAAPTVALDSAKRHQRAKVPREPGKQRHHDKADKAVEINNAVAKHVAQLAEHRHKWALVIM